jgi:hypothetical protein
VTIASKQLRLLPEGSHQSRAPTHPAQGFASGPTQLAKVLWAEIGQVMLLAVSPDVFHWVEFRRIGRQELQLNEYCNTGVWPRGDQVRTLCGRSLKPLSSTNTTVRPWWRAFFLFPASALASIAGWLVHRAGSPGPPVAGSSSPRNAGSSKRAPDETSAQFVSRSDRPPATSSGAKCHTPAPRDLPSSLV